MGNIKIIYEDISVTAKEDSSLSSNGLQTFCNLAELRNDNSDFIKYASLEYKRWKLDGTFKNLPNALGSPKNGFAYWGDKLSDENGFFENKPILTINFSNYETSVGATLTFDTTTNDFPSDITIKWYQNETLISQKDFQPNSAEYFADNYVQNFNKVEIIFNKTSKPYRYAKLSNIAYGIVRTFVDTDVSNINVIEEVDLTSAEITVNTMDFTLLNLAGTVFSFQKRQPIKLYFKENLVGMYYITKATQTSNKTFEIEAEDLIGALDRYTFMGGMYTNALVSEIFASLFGTNIPYELDASFSNSTITGYIPICTCREALTYIAFSIGAIVTTSKSDKIKIEPLNNNVAYSYNQNEVFMGNSFQRNDKVTSVEVTEYNYIQNASATTDVLYNGSETSAVVRFTEPHFNLTCTGGTIVSSNCNHAIINLNSGATEMILQGKRYEVSTTLKTKVDPIITPADFENKVAFSDCFLINKTNVEVILNRLYNYYITNKDNSFDVALDLAKGGKIGDKIEFETDFKGKQMGYITELNFNPIGSKLFANATIKVVEV